MQPSQYARSRMENKELWDYQDVNSKLHYNALKMKDIFYKSQVFKPASTLNHPMRRERMIQPWPENPIIAQKADLLNACSLLWIYSFMFSCQNNSLLWIWSVWTTLWAIYSRWSCYHRLCITNISNKHLIKPPKTELWQVQNRNKGNHLRGWCTLNPKRWFQKFVLSCKKWHLSGKKWNKY